MSTLPRRFGLCPNCVFDGCTNRSALSFARTASSSESRSNWVLSSSEEFVLRLLSQLHNAMTTPPNPTTPTNILMMLKRPFTHKGRPVLNSSSASKPFFSFGFTTKWLIKSVTAKYPTSDARKHALIHKLLPVPTKIDMGFLKASTLLRL